MFCFELYRNYGEQDCSKFFQCLASQIDLRYLLIIENNYFFTLNSSQFFDLFFFSGDDSFYNFTYTCIQLVDRDLCLPLEGKASPFLIFMRSKEGKRKTQLRVSLSWPLICVRFSTKLTKLFATKPSFVEK